MGEEGAVSGPSEAQLGLRQEAKLRLVVAVRVDQIPRPLPLLPPASRVLAPLFPTMPLYGPATAAVPRPLATRTDQGMVGRVATARSCNALCSGPYP